MQKKYWFLILLIALAFTAGFVLWSNVDPSNNGDSKIAEKFAHDFVYRYHNGLKSRSDGEVSYRLKQWSYRKNHYILNIDAAWESTCCGINMTKCLEEYNFELQVRSDGKIYSHAIQETNGCSMQHKIAGQATNALVNSLILGAENYNQN